MSTGSAQILERFRTSYGKEIDLTLRPAYRDLLSKLGDPHQSLPPVLHVAGTNGKGSTCAFMRAVLEAEGYRVHVYTSPHLVRFHERIRVAGALISEEELTDILTLCERLAIPNGVSYFEAATAAAMTAFARHPADFTILEVGLGGRLDATNIVDKPLATVITRLSFDHREYLGDTLAAIATEKAGIMREGIPCFIAHQPDALALAALKQTAVEKKTSLRVSGVDWQVHEEGGGFVFEDNQRKLVLPTPALLGAHQLQNAGLAIAALSVLTLPLSDNSIARGMQTVQWPARLQKLELGQPAGSLIKRLPSDFEVWLDGGHNDSAGEVLAAQINRWKQSDGDDPRPLYVLMGMLTTKRPEEFLSPFLDRITALRTVDIPDEPLAFTAEALAREIAMLSLSDVEASTVLKALDEWGGSLSASARPPRILICGSLYLAGAILSLLSD